MTYSEGILGNKGNTYLFCISSPCNMLEFLLVCNGLWNHICSFAEDWSFLGNTDEAIGIT